MQQNAVNSIDRSWTLSPRSSGMRWDRIRTKKALCKLRVAHKTVISRVVAQFVYNLTGGLQRENVAVAVQNMDVAPALTGNTPISLRPSVVSAAAPLLV